MILGAARLRIDGSTARALEPPGGPPPDEPPATLVDEGERAVDALPRLRLGDVGAFQIPEERAEREDTREPNVSAIRRPHPDTAPEPDFSASAMRSASFRVCSA